MYVFYLIREFGMAFRNGYTSGGGYNNYVPIPNYHFAYQDHYNRIMNNPMLMYNMNLPLIQSYQTRPYHNNNFYTSTPRLNNLARDNVPATKGVYN